MRCFEDMSELAAFAPDTSHVRNAIVFCDHAPASETTIASVYNWLCGGCVADPPYACFVGKHGSQGDDDMDMVSVMKGIEGRPGPQIMTTWHDTETVSEVAELPPIFSINTERDVVWIMVGPTQTPFEIACRKALDVAPLRWG